MPLKTIINRQAFPNRRRTSISASRGGSAAFPNSHRYLGIATSHRASAFCFVSFALGESVAGTFEASGSRSNGAM